MNNKNKYSVPIELLSKYIANEATETERAELEQWRNANNKNSKEFNAFYKLWKESEKVKHYADIDIKAEWNRMEKTISVTATKTISITRVLQIAASVIVLFGLSFLLYNQTQTISTKTQFAQVQIIELPDGSKVTLNSKSKITYSKEFGKSNRLLTLKGEAFFDVTPNTQMPFIIDAQGATIKVVGTKFNVKAYKYQPEVKVAVVEGTVQLFETKQPTKKAVLNAGESGIYIKKKKAIKKRPRIEANEISWKTMKMSFENSTLLEVVDVISNTYHVSISVSDVVMDCTITVEFDQKDLASVLKVLKSTLDLRITKQGDTILIDGEGCGS